MSIASAARRIRLANDRASAQYFADQNRGMAANPEPVRRVWFEDSYVTPALPVTAIERITGVSATESAPVIPNTDIPATPRLQAPPAQFGAPQNLTIEDFRRMAPEDQKRAIRAVLLVEGARERMAPVPGRTLTESLSEELLYQRRMIKIAAARQREGRSERFSKSAAKRDRSKGAKPLAQGGTASFTRGTPLRVTDQGATWLPVPGERASVEVRKLRKIDRTLLKKNAQ